jgi:hypothetical protein
MHLGFQSGDPYLCHLLDEIRRGIAEIAISNSIKSQIVADLGSIEAQLSAPKPRAFIITECLRSIRAIFEGMAGNALAIGLAYEIGKMIK